MPDQPQSKSTVSKAANTASETGIKLAAKAASQAVSKGITAIASSIPVVGTAAGALIGKAAGYVTERIAVPLLRLTKKALSPGNWLNVFVAAGAFIGAIIAGFAAAIPTIVGVIIFSPIVLGVIIALIIFIINSGGYITQPAGLGLSTGSININTPPVVQSQYIEVTKTPDQAGPFQNNNLPLTITYTIRVRAKLGPLTDIKFDNTCQATKRVSGGGSTTVSCPQPIPDSTPAEIAAGQTWSWQYTVTYPSPDFQDSYIIDTFTVQATSSNQSSIANASAALQVGNPPEDCPSGWPVDEPITIVNFPNQCGATVCSHLGYQAIDIPKNLGTPVRATHSGVATVCGNPSYGYGIHVRITSVCGGKQFQSVYAHLQSIQISPGIVAKGQVIGTVDNTGYSLGNHLHYEFRYPGVCDDQGPSTTWPILMAPPFIPWLYR